VVKKIDFPTLMVKQKQPSEEIFTQVIPVVVYADIEQLG
jgi:hypothetical protein